MLEIIQEKFSHLVPSLAICSVSGVSVSIKAISHLEGLDVLSGAHSARALSDDARQTHLLLHIYLVVTKWLSVSQLHCSHWSVITISQVFLIMCLASYLNPGVSVMGS